MVTICSMKTTPSLTIWSQTGSSTHPISLRSKSSSGLVWSKKKITNSHKISSITSIDTRTLTKSSTNRNNRLQLSISTKTMKQHHLYLQQLVISMDTKESCSTSIWRSGKLERVERLRMRIRLMEFITYMVKDITLMEIHTTSSTRITMELWQHQLHTTSVDMVTKATSQFQWPMNRNTCKMSSNLSSNQTLLQTKSQLERTQTISTRLKIMAFLPKSKTITLIFETMERPRSLRKENIHQELAQIS